MSGELQEALEERAVVASEEVAEQIKEEYVSLLEREDQGADGLVPYVRVVDMSELGLGDGHAVRVLHPFASLHEKGGHIEPTYGQAAALGWTRDEMYEALEDCNEFVDRKGTLMKAVDRVRGEV